MADALSTPSKLSPDEPNPVAGRPASTRLMSLDALRGFDMFWIVGGEEIVFALRQISDNKVVQTLVEQMDHKEWQGLAFYDLIFPLFVFIVGVSLVFSLGKTLREQGRRAAVRRILTRALVLYLLGIIYYGGLTWSVDKIRLLGVLQRIALCYMFAGLAFCYLRTRGQVLLCVALLVGYWALLTFVPVPGVGAGKYAEGKNLSDYIDEMFLPWRKWSITHDPEGLLSTLPAIATCLLGVFAGTLLKSASVSAAKKVFWLTASGIVLAALGWLWSEHFPVIKKIWTSSFVLVTGGYSCLLLAAFYLVVDVWKFQKWAQPFVWIGVNPLTIYMVHNLVEFRPIALRFVGGPVKEALGPYSELAIASVIVALTFGLCYLLYRKKVFIRL
jgi:predicted acyltransferase